MPNSTHIRGEQSSKGDEEKFLFPAIGTPKVPARSTSFVGAWPQTFERSISLLASPILPKADAERFSKSPAPGRALRRNTELDGGIYTPEQAGRYGSIHRLLSSSERNLTTFDPKPGLDVSTHLLQQRQDEAKQYRNKVISEQTKTPQKHHDKASFLQCVFNLSNILMGVGLLGLPYVFRLAGYLGGTMCLIIFGFICWRTAILIGRALNGDSRPAHCFFDSTVDKLRSRTSLSSFPDIARDAFGESGCFVLSTILYFELFSCVSIFFVSIGDHLHQLMPAVSAATHMTVVCGISLIPTILLRTPALLSYLSMVGTFATIAVVASVVGAGIVEGDIVAHSTNDESHHIDWDASGLPLGFGLVAYCFSGHAIVPSIYSSMKEPRDFERMVTVTFTIVLVCCCAVGLSGYYMFGDSVDDQITLSLEQHSKAKTAMTALTWLMVLTAFSKVTLTMFPLALGFEELFSPFLESEEMVNFTSGTIKLVLSSLALFVGIYVPSFSYLCALVGMVCTMTVSVVFPALAHLKLFAKDLTLVEKSFDYLFICLGVVVAVFGTVTSLLS